MKTTAQRACVMAAVACAMAAMLALPAHAFAAQSTPSLTTGSLIAQSKSSASSDENAFTTQAVAMGVKDKAGRVLPNGYYIFVSANNAQRLIGVAKDSRKDKANVQLQKEGEKAQVWKFVYNNVSETYIITNKRTGKSLTASNRARSGMNVYQATLKKQKDLCQRWIITSTATGYKIVSAANKNACVTVKGAKAKNGANVLMSKDKKSLQQRFWIFSASKWSSGQVIKNGTYALTSARNDAKALEVAKGLVKEGTDIRLNSRTKKIRNTDGLKQMFKITFVKKGYYRIEGAGSFKALTATGKKTVTQMAFKGTDKQLWKPVVNEDGSVKFVNKKYGRALDLVGGKAKNKALATMSKVKAASEDADAKPSTQDWMVNPATTGLTTAAMLSIQKAVARGSGTDYFIGADLSAFELNVLERDGKNKPWSIIKTCNVACGMHKCTRANDGRVWSKWHYFGDDHGYRAWYWTNLGKGRAFHSVICRMGTQSITDGRTKGYISDGCMRLKMSNAKWVYDNIPVGTNVSWFYK